MLKSLGSGLGYTIGVVIAVPLLIVIVNFLFLRGNQATSEQINQYIHDSEIIEVFIPHRSDDNSKVYIPKLTKGSSTRVIYRTSFYSKEHQKQMVLITFSDIDFSAPFGHDNAYLRNSVIYSGGYFLVRANQNQWNNPSYGTEENPMPVFGVELLAKIDKKIKLSNDQKKAFDITDEVNYKFVEQYLDHFLPKKAFKELFTSN